MIDCHCHLNVEFKDGRPQGAKDKSASEMIANAKKAGLSNVINAATSWKENQIVLENYKKYKPFIQIQLGLSPHNAGMEYNMLEKHLQLIEARKHDIVGLGEIGLDYHHQGWEADKEVQKKVFRAQLQVAEANDFPVALHTRKAEEEVLEILKEFKSVRVQMHCFYVPKYLDECVKRGYFISVPTLSGKQVERVIQRTPLEQLLCETDSPFLWPTWPNEPANVKSVYEKVSKLKNISFEKVEEQIDKNVKTLYKFK